MKKVNVYTASKDFTAEVAQYTVKGLWRKEYSERLRAQVDKDVASIAGLENCRGSVVMSDEQVDSAIEEKRAHILALEEAYNEVRNHWTKVKANSLVTRAYKEWAPLTADRKAVLASLLKEWAGLEVDKDSDIVMLLYLSTLGDGAGDNTKQLVNTGVASLSSRTKSEFVKIIYRELFDYLVEKGTIRFVGNVVRGGGEDVAELLVETPKFTLAKCKKALEKKSKKSAK